MALNLWQTSIRRCLQTWNILCLQKFLNKVEEVFLCICCQEVVFQPITTECQHNVCRVRSVLLCRIVYAATSQHYVNESWVCLNTRLTIHCGILVSEWNLFILDFQECLQRSFKAEVYTCPACRHDLGKNYSMTVNKSLQDILNLLFPGYSNGRWSLVLRSQPSKKQDVNCKRNFQWRQ